MQDDIKTMENKFSWFTHFSRIMQILGFVFLIGGILFGAYFYSHPKIFVPQERWTYIGISGGVGALFSLACIIVSNIIVLTLQIEQNTKVAALLLQKLLEKDEE